MAIRNGVKAGGEKFHSLNSLMALAQWKNAPEGGKFTVRLTGEVDGVTNGPMLSHILLGAASTVGELFNLVNKGGFFQNGSEFQNYNVFRGSEGAMDLYETVAKSIINKVNQVGAGKPLLNAIWTFTGKLDDGDKVSKDGRNFVKKPITALMFGSGLDKVVQGMAELFVESVYASIEKVAAGKADKDTVLKSINDLLAPKSRWPADMTVQDMLQRSFTKRELDQIHSQFARNLGETVKEVMETEFAVLIARRNKINRTAQLTFGIYEAAYQAARDSYLDFLAKNDMLDVDGAGNLKWDMTAAQERKLQVLTRKIQPIMATVMSLRNGDLSSGLTTYKTDTQQSSDPLYQAKMRINRTQKERANKKARYRNVSGTAQGFEAPGARMVPFATHSLDSGVSHSHIAETEALNIHDAQVTGMGNFKQVAGNLNLGTWEALLEYSPANEIYMTLERMVNGLDSLMQDPEIAKFVGPAVKGFLADAMKRAKYKGKPERFLTDMLIEAKHEAYQADLIRLGALAQMQSIDQYALEGGQYKVTDADRANAQRRLDALVMTVPSDVLAKAEAVSKAMANMKALAPSESLNLGETVSSSIQKILGVSDVQATRLMKALVDLGSTPEQFKSQMQAVLTRMREAGDSLAEAVANELKGAEEAALTQFLGAHLKNGVTSHFGKVGKPAVAPAADLVSLFEAKPEMGAEDLIKEISHNLAKLPDNKTAQYYRKLAAMAYKAIGPDVRVKYVTPETIPDSVSAKPDSGARGWYVPATQTIYVLSPDFVESGLTSEMLLHELTHAALHSIIANPTTELQKELVKEIEDLRAKAQTFMADNNITGFDMEAAVSNVQEFVAWGMTNRAFQAKVLGKFKVPNTLGKMVTAVQEFINKLASMLFNKKLDNTSAEVDGLTALIANVTMLYQEVASESQKRTKREADKTNQVFTMASAAAPQGQSLNQAIDDFTTEQVFDALSGTGNSQAFIDRLQSILGDVVNKMHGPFGAVKTAIEKQTGKTAQDIWAHAQVTGQRPFASKVLNAGLKFSQKETYVAEQVEVILRAALDSRSAPTSAIYREFQKVYTEARTVLKGKIDQGLYKFLFMPQQSADGRSDYMSRFVTLALTSEEFNKALGFATTQADMSFKGKTFMQRIETLWRAASDWVGATVTGTYTGQQANDKVASLVQKLVQIEARNKGQIKSAHSIFDFMDPVEKEATEMLQKAKTQLGKLADSKMVKGSRFGVVKAAGVLTSIAAHQRVEAVIEGMQRVRDQVNDASNGAAMGLVQYVKGVPQWVNSLVLSGKFIEKRRMEVITDTALAVLEAFKDKGAYLQDSDKAAISQVFLRTGMHTLLDKLGMQGIQQLLEDRAALNAAIKEEIGQLSSYPEIHYYIKQAHGLGFYKATGQVAVVNQMLNAGNIAKLLTTGKTVPAHAADAEQVINRLVALYALKHTSASA